MSSFERPSSIRRSVASVAKLYYFKLQRKTIVELFSSHLRRFKKLVYGRSGRTIKIRSSSTKKVRLSSYESNRNFSRPSSLNRGD